MEVYCATNRVNGKVYIGITRRPLRLRVSQHKSRASTGRGSGYFHIAIRKYGFGAFEWSVLESCASIEDLQAAEIKWVKAYRSTERGMGYNRTDGGSGVSGYQFSDEAKQKISAKMRGRLVSTETRQKLSSSNKGKQPSEMAISAWRAKGWDKVNRDRIRAYRLGTKHSQEAIEKMRSAQLLRVKESYSRKVSMSEIGKIVQLRANGESFKAIGIRYGVTPSTIFYVCKRANAHP